MPYAGWELPVQYPTGPTEEHKAVRSVGGVFDVSHMARVRIQGADALKLLQKVTTRDLRRSKPGFATYGLMTYADGTVVDDVIVNQLEDEWLMVANGANRRKDLQWLRAHARGLDVTLRDETLDTVMVACQGPRMAEYLSDFLEADLSRIRRFKCRTIRYRDCTILVSRTGYTGEDGFELILDAESGPGLVEALLQSCQSKGVLPCGLAARDSLRLEACYPLYGHEIDSGINPIEANLAWTVSFKKPDFIGRDALLKARLEGPDRRLLGFAMLDRGVPRAGYRVHVDAMDVGWVTSGIKSPTLDQFIGLAMCNASVAERDVIQIEIRNSLKDARVVPTPFYPLSND